VTPPGEDRPGAPGDDDVSVDVAAPAATGALAELRAKDAIERPARVEAELSADEIAQLEAWFGRPSVDVLAEKGEIELDYFGRPVDVEARKRREEARARATEAVEPWMIALLERHVPAGDRLLRFHASLEVHIDPSRFERELITLNSPELTEVERPGDLDKHLKEVSPQALLRDLHRPVDEFTIEYERPAANEVDIDPFAAAREAIAAGHQWKPEMAALEQARRALQPVADAKAERWADIRTPRRRVVE
jgi:hypothetical protein